jgi:hypothetical protein
MSIEDESVDVMGGEDIGDWDKAVNNSYAIGQLRICTIY